MSVGSLAVGAPAAAATPAPNTLSILAGGGTTAPATTPIPATSASIGPGDVAVDSAGNVYVADLNNWVVEKVTPRGNLSVIAGGGTTAPSTTAIPATSASIDPGTVAVDSAGNVYIADPQSDVIDKVTAGGSLSVIAGGGTTPPWTTPIPATSADLDLADGDDVPSQVTGVAVDSAGNLYLTDTNGNGAWVFKVTRGGMISLFAGGGEASYSATPIPATSIGLAGACAPAVDSAGDVYFLGGVTWKVTPGGMASMIAGGGTTAPSTTPIPATSASLNGAACGLAVDSAGEIYATIDSENSSGVVLEVTPGGTLSVIAGGGTTAPSTTPIPATSANIDPGGVAVDSAGNIYITDLLEYVEEIGAAGPSGCDQVTQADGDYEFGGCVTSEDDGTQDVTDQESNLNGIDVSASASNAVTYDDGGSAGDELTSAGDSTLSLNLDGTDIPVYTGVLDDSLTGPISVDVRDGTSAASSGARLAGPAAGKPTQIAGITIAGRLSLIPVLKNGKPAGSLTASVPASLPAVFGGGKATLTASSTVNKGLTSVTVKLDKASFIQLFKLTGLTLTWKPGSDGTDTWQVAATASTGGKKTAKLAGSLTYDDDTLEAASLSLSGLSLAGLADLSSLKITYEGGDWSGKATFGTGKSQSSADIALSFDDSGLVSGTVKASNMSLFGVLDVKTFLLSYDGDTDTWKVTVTAADGGGVSGSMTATDGVISDASLKVTKVSFLGKFTVSSAEVSYAAEAPNGICNKVEGDSIWCGDWQVLLPSTSVVSGVSGTLAVADAAFASGSIDVTGNVPLLDGIFLSELGGKVVVNPPPTKISGTAALRFGPMIRGTSLLAFKGTLTRELPGGDTSGSYHLNGDLSALSVLTGHVDVTVPGSGAPTTINLTATATAGKGSATGVLTGSFTSGSFTLVGTVTIHIPGLTLPHGSFKADNLGMAACGTYTAARHTFEGGFEYDWSGGLTFLGKKGCTETGF